MSVTYPRKIDGMYYGNISNDEARAILNIRNKDVVPGLKRMVFNFEPELVLRSIYEGRSIREIVREDGIDISKYYGELRDYQTVGTAFMYLSKRSIIGDGVGVGKTAEISGLLNYLRYKGEMKRFLMAVETSALGQTQCELMRFTGLRIVQLPSESAKMKKMIDKIDWNKVDGIVIKHSSLRSDVLSKWLSLYIGEDGLSSLIDLFILDESSVIKNRGTKMFQYTENICNLVPRVHFMNATTFETSIMDIYNQMDMMYSELLPRKWRIEKDYCTFGTKTYWVRGNDGKAQMKYARDMKGYKNEQGFKDSLKLVYFGRSKRDVGKELPHQYLTYEVEPTTDQSLALAKGYRYMEVLNSPSNIDGLGIEFNRESVPKLDRLVSLIENEFSEQQVMIYCFHIDAQRVISDELKKIGRSPVILNGDNTDSERVEIIDEFNSGKKDVIITNIQKSLNLYAGDVCIFYSMVGNPARMEQVRGRIDRSVDDSIKTYVLLVYKGTDEYKFFTETAKQRAKDARNLTIDAKTAVDFFIESMGLV